MQIFYTSHSFLSFPQCGTCVDNMSNCRQIFYFLSTSCSYQLIYYQDWYSFYRVKCNLTQLTTRSKLHSLSGVAWCGVSVRVYQQCGGCLQRLQRGRGLVRGVLTGRLRVVLAVSGPLAYQACTCACPRGFCLAQLSVWWRLCAFQYFLSLLSLFRREGSLLNSFSPELTIQCDGCLIWCLGWRVELVAGLRVGQAYGVFHRPGFGLLA